MLVKVAPRCIDQLARQWPTGRRIAGPEAIQDEVISENGRAERRSLRMGAFDLLRLAQQLLRSLVVLVLERADDRRDELATLGHCFVCGRDGMRCSRLVRA